MMSLKHFPRVAVAAILSLSFAAAPAAATQRRRRAPARTTPARPARPAPPAAAQTPAGTGAQTPAGSGAQAAARRRAEDDRAIEDLLSADAYGVYAEVRRIGTLSQAEDVKTTVASLRLLGDDDETKPLTDLVAFVSENLEDLADSRAAVAFMPTRGDLPLGLFALELPSPEDAAAFEPKLRRWLGGQLQGLGLVEGQKKQEAAPARRGAAQRRRGEERPEAKPASMPLTFRRAGRWLLTAGEPFTLKLLRGDPNSATLAQNVRFQSARNRFTSESVFVYVETDLAQRGWMTQMEKARASQESIAVVGAGDAGGEISVTAPVIKAPPVGEPMPEGEPPPEDPAETGPVGSPEEVVPEDAEPPEGAVLATVRPVTPTEEQKTTAQLGGLLRNLWGGFPRIPGAVALGIGLGGGQLSARLAVENSSDGTVNVIPFLPNIISGAPVTAEAASVAPADSDIFFTGALDWPQIFTATLGTASLSPSLNVSAASVAGIGAGGETEGEGGDKPPAPGETIAAAEKLFGFKFKEDLLASLGSEVALSLPFDVIGPPSARGGAPKEGEKEPDARPGVLLLISLNNPDKIREILPRVLMALGFASPGSAFSQPERREGFEIRGGVGGVSYAVINNFLVASDDVKHVRYAVDSFAARRTLADSNKYRDSTQWQARQKLAQLFVSETLMRSAVEDTKKRSGGSTDPVVRALLSQLDVEPQAASYEVTNQGDVLMHEARVPLKMLRAYAVAIMVSVKDAPVLTGEAMATYALNRIVYAQHAYKEDKKKERYGSLEELVAEGLLEKDFMDSLEYKLELNASGDKFAATATPKNYGKTGRRSFFVSEKGEVRGADHKGQPATAEDPLISEQ